MFACESYLKDRTGFEVFIIWALVKNNGCFEQCGRIEESVCMQRNDDSYNFRNAFHKDRQATSFYKVNGNEKAVSVRKQKHAGSSSIASPAQDSSNVSFCSIRTSQ